VKREDDKAGDPHGAAWQQRYGEADHLAGDEPRAAASTRAMVLAAAARGAGMQAEARPLPGDTARTQDTAANHPRWRTAAMASVMLTMLVGLLTVQVEREDGRVAADVAADPVGSGATGQRASDASPTPAAMGEPLTSLRGPLPPAIEPKASPVEPNEARRRNTPIPAERARAAVEAARTEAAAAAAAATAPLPEPPSAPTAPTAAAPARPASPAPSPAEPAATAIPAPDTAQAPAAQAKAAGRAAESDSATSLTGVPTQGITRQSSLLGAANAPDRLALHAAAARGDLIALDAAISAGADLNATDADGRTPLAAAAHANRLAAVQRLLAAGADPNRPDREGLTPRQDAHRRGFDAVAAAIEAQGGR
jgi:hypothetical protein